MRKIVVSASGNEDNIISHLFDNPNTPYYDVVPVPAAISSSFTVAATDEVDARAHFSNYGTSRLNYVDIAAPGFRILTLCADHEKCYEVWYGGTSFSAPWWPELPLGSGGGTPPGITLRSWPSW